MNLIISACFLTAEAGWFGFTGSGVLAVVTFGLILSKNRTPVIKFRIELTR